MSDDDTILCFLASALWEIDCHFEFKTLIFKITTYLVSSAVINRFRLLLIGFDANLILNNYRNIV